MLKPLRSLFKRTPQPDDTVDDPGAALRTDPARLEAWLTEWIAREAKLDPATLHRDKQFSDFGVDSLMAATLSGELEKLLGRTLSPSIAWEYPTIGELAGYLAAGGSGAEFDMDAAPGMAAELGAEERAAG
jgi:acyl carrier protein